MHVTKVASITMMTILFSGCGTIMHGTNQNIEVQSSPSGAKVETSPTTGTYTTPTTLNLPRKNNYVLNFSSPGYTPASFNIHNSIGTGTVIADVLLTGLVGVVVDGITGSWYGLSPEAATVTMTRIGAGVGPNEIKVYIAKSDNGTGVNIKTDAPDVQVSVQKQ